MLESEPFFTQKSTLALETNGSKRAGSLKNENHRTRSFLVLHDGFRLRGTQR